MDERQGGNRRTVSKHSYTWPFESIGGGVNGVHVLPIRVISHSYACPQDVKTPTVIMRDTALQYLGFSNRRLIRISHNIDKCNPIQPNHLFEIDVSMFIPVDVLDGDSKISSVGIRFEDGTPIRCGGFRHCHMQEESRGS